MTENPPEQQAEDYAKKLERQKVDPAIIEAFREAAKALIEARKEKVPASA